MKSKRKQMVMGIVIVAAIAGGVVYWMAQPDEMPPTTPVQRETLEDLAEEIGEIVSDTHRIMDAATPGRIRQLNAEIGQTVSAGMLLVEIDSRDWLASFDRIHAEIDATRASYQQAMEAASRRRQQAQATLDFAAVQLEEAEEQLGRVGILYDSGAVSQQELLQAKMEVTALESGVEQARLSVAAAGDAMSPVARGTFEAAIAQLETELRHLEAQRDYWQVRSPVSGTVVARHVEPGAFVQPGQALVEIGDLNHLYVTTELLAREMSGVTTGMPVRVIHRDLGTAPVTGRVRQIHPTAFVSVSELGIEQRRVRVDIEIDKLDPEWRPGYEVDVELIRETRENVLTIPERSAFFIDGEAHVFIWVNDQHEMRRVETGLTAHNRTEIISGITEGELVLTEPENI